MDDKLKIHKIQSMVLNGLLLALLALIIGTIANLYLDKTFPEQREKQSPTLPPEIDTGLPKEIFPIPKEQIGNILALSQGNARESACTGRKRCI